MKTRFAPSPTGLIHLGNARTALFSALYAAGKGGTFLLRIEDTDLERSQENYTHSLMHDMRWLGLDWQEGAEVGGEHHPYYQAMRMPIYDRYYEQLIEIGHAYPCFCTEEQLALSRKLQRARGIAPRYTGTCRSLSKEEIAKKISEGLQPTLRFRTPDSTKVEFNDIVKGCQVFNSDDIGDFIIRRSNGMPSFMFCNAIDDSLMDVTHAIRGEDHLTNTPRQIMILQALGMRVPQYGHISLILGMDGSPLSKRNGSRSIQDLRNLGYLPLAVVNYLARLGHYYESNDFMSFQRLAELFKEEALSKSPARYDEAQLAHWQKAAVLSLDFAAFKEWIGAEIMSLVPADKHQEFYSAIHTNVLFPSEVKEWAEIFFGKTISDKNIDIIQEAGKRFFEVALNSYQEKTDHTAMYEILKTQLGVKGKALFMPVRVALTGEQHGPEMAAIFSLLGTEQVLARFQQAVNSIE